MIVGHFRNKIVVKLLGAVGISFFVSFVIMSIQLQIFDSLVYPYSHTNIWIMLFIIFTISIISFIVIFLLLIRKKISYLKSVSQCVHSIAHGKLGLTIEISGRDELAHLAQNINYMSKELEDKFEYERQLERAKHELITNVSHDLRTPLTSIIGYLDLLKNGQYNSNMQSQKYVEIAYVKSQRLKYLIDELFEYTCLSREDAKLNWNEVDASSVLEQIVGEYLPIFEKENLKVRKSITQETIPICMDVEKMVRVYENLLINALKYSVKPSELSISLKKIGNKAILKVSNQVEKSPASDPNTLFERFYRGDKSRNSEQGTGLGLAISKRIVELHNGKIHVEYKKGWMSFIIEHPIL